MSEQTDSEIAIPTRGGALRWWDVPLVLIGGAVIGGIVTAAAVFGVVVVARAHGVDPRLAIANLRLDFFANHVALVTGDVGFLIMAWWVARWRSGSALGTFFPPIGRRILTLALLSGVALSLAVNGGNELLSRAHLAEFHDTDVERAIQPHTALQFVVAFAVIVLFAPLAEEFFFRGILMRWVRQWGGVAVAIGISALAFAAVHGQMFLHPGIQGWLFSAELLAAGIVLGLWAQRGGSLRASFATHAAYNAAAMIFGALFP